MTGGTRRGSVWKAAALSAAALLVGAVHASAQVKVSTASSDRAVFGSDRYYVHHANGHYWLAFDRGSLTSPGPGAVLFSSPDGITWTSQGSLFSFDPGDVEWAVRYLGTTIVGVAYNSSNRHYVKGTLNAGGTVTWDQPQAATGDTSTLEQPLNLALANSLPVYFRSDDTSNGTLWRGNALVGPTWGSLGVAPSLAAATAGGFEAGAVFQVDPGGDPNDLIIIRGTTSSVSTANSHRVVSVKWDDSAGSFDPGWYNVSTLNGGLTEDSRTLVDVNGSFRQDQFSAVMDGANQIHVVYTNQNNEVVHYRRTTGFGGTWARLFDGIFNDTVLANYSRDIDRVTLTALPGGELLLYYSRNETSNLSDEAIYYRKFDGTSWGGEHPLFDGPIDTDSIGHMETVPGGVTAGIAWVQGLGPTYDVMFSLVAESNIRSIGTNAGVLYSSGTATMKVGTNIVNFSDCPPSNIGRGDKLTIDTGGSQEVFYVLDRDSTTRFTVQGSAAIDHSGGVSFQFERAYNSPQAWETARQGDLVAAGTREVGVMYDDGPFSGFAGQFGLLIDGPSWTSGPFNYPKLVAQPGEDNVGASSQRGRGHAGAGVRMDGGGVTKFGIWVGTSYARIEGIELHGFSEAGTGGGGGVVVGDGSEVVTGVVLDGLLIHDFRGDANINKGVRVSESGPGADVVVKNTIVYDGDEGFFINWAPSSMTVEGCTAYGMDEGVYGGGGSMTARNTIAVGNTTGDFTGTVSQSYNMSSDTSATGTGSITGVSAADQFVSIVAGSEDLHLKPGSDAVDAGINSGGEFEVDIDGSQRGGGTGSNWDIGADELRNTNYRSIGTNAGVLYGTGTASIAAGATTVTFSGSLPTDVGLGDQLTVGGEIFYLLARVDATTATVQSPATAARSGAFQIVRSFNTLEAWEAASGGDLVTDDRLEVGVAYADGAFDTSTFSSTSTGVTIDGAVTDATRFRWLTVAPGQRHAGVAAASPTTSVVMDGQGGSRTTGIQIYDDYTRVSWFEIKAFRNPASSTRSVRVRGENVLLENLIVHDFFSGSSTVRGIEDNSGECLTSFTVRNSILYDGDSEGVRLNRANHSATLENCSIYNIRDAGASGVRLAAGTIGVYNTIALSSGTDFNDSGGGMSGSNNMDSDGSSGTVGFASSISGASSGAVFVNDTLGSEDLHLKDATSGGAVDGGVTRDFCCDIDAQGRPAGAAWDIGADEFAALAAVELQSFGASGRDGAVVLDWETASELKNLGFHLYRSLAAEGPWERLTDALIPGLGSSPVGASYGYTDAGLSNGVRYYYLLEDVESTGATKRHGPVWATPHAGEAGGPTGPAEEKPGAAPITYGDPDALELTVLERGKGGLLVELRTGGFLAIPAGDGTVRIEVPGFAGHAEPGQPDVPALRTWLEAVVGRRAEIVSVQPQEVERFAGLRVAPADDSELLQLDDGTLQLRRVRRGEGAAFRSGDLYPETGARLLGEAFQGETKKLHLELSPLRWDPASGELQLAKRLRVRLVFQRPERGETQVGVERGRRPRGGPKTAGDAAVVARLHTTEAGLYAARFEDVFGARARAVNASELRLSRQGEDVAYHLEPDPRRFAPGSRLYFVSGGAALNPWGDSAVYELERGAGGATMALDRAAPAGAAVGFYHRLGEWEQNIRYVAALTEAEDLWMWDFIVNPRRAAYPIALEGLASAAEPARLEVWLQGASDFASDPDHHVRFFVNGIPVGETSWEGKRPVHVSAEFSSALLREGDNLVEIHNVGDTGADYSGVYLNRFTLGYPRTPVADAGSLWGTFSRSGAVEVGGLDSGSAIVDTSVPGAERWLSEALAGAGGVSFRVEAGRRYLAVSAEAVRSPRVVPARVSDLLDPLQQADWLLVGPEAFLAEAAPLLDHRRSQGLSAKAVAIEDVFDLFGHGEARPEALRDFLGWAFHAWSQPSPRYVVLLGDATYDPKGYRFAKPNSVPPLMVRSPSLWTASDPGYAAVNGDDELPDLAIGRLPAASPDEVRALVFKIVAWEGDGRSLASGPVALVADNPDHAGDFEGDAEQLATGLLRDRDPQRIYLSQLGGATRPTIMESFDRGASLVSYLGHGGVAVWASENVFSTWDVAGLAGPQPQQPLVLTMNCMNGYFLHPALDALAEALVKAEGKGAIAAFSPSGMSLHDAARRYHEAILVELQSGRHRRLGDAVSAAQARYLETGASPDLIGLYHLLGDPALVVE